MKEYPEDCPSCGVETRGETRELDGIWVRETTYECDACGNEWVTETHKVKHFVDEDGVVRTPTTDPNRFRNPPTFRGVEGVPGMSAEDTSDSDTNDE